MAESAQYDLDQIQIEELASLMSLQTKNFSKIKHPDSWRLFLGLYQQQVVYPKKKDWMGMKAKVLAEMVDVTKNEHRHLSNLVDLGFISPQQDILTSARDVTYILTEEGRVLVESVLHNSENMIKFVSAEVIAGEIPRILNVLDRYNIIVGTLAYLYNYVDDGEGFPNLYDLSQTLDLQPKEIFEVIKSFCIINRSSIEKSQTPLFEIHIGKPRLRKMAFNCNDWLICNTLCNLCHNTEIDLTPLGRKMCKSLVKNPQDMNYRVRQASTEKFLTISILMNFFLLSLAFIFNESLIDVFLFSMAIIILSNSFTYQILRNKNKQLRFVEEMEE